MKIARSLYEAELNIWWLKNHPEDLRNFLDYSRIQRKQLYDAMNEDQRMAMPQKQRNQIMADYKAVLPRFATKSNSNRPRGEWCKESIYKRAKEYEHYGQQQMEAEGLKGNTVSRYNTFYRYTSSMVHLDSGGVLAFLDYDKKADMAPSWEHLDDALVATASVLRCVSYFDEMGKFGMQERLRRGPFEDYVAACKGLI
jgi:hypothetical protein